jgi:urease accessory protein
MRLKNRHASLIIAACGSFCMVIRRTSVKRYVPRIGRIAGPHVLMSVSTPLDQPRAIGRAAVSSKQDGQRSRIDGLRQSGALKLLFPSCAQGVQSVIVNTAGGITGGDDFEIEARAGPGSDLTLTTQAAERVYRAQYGQIGRLSTRLKVESAACLHWLPQETILYERSALRRTLCVDLAANGRFLMVEPVIFGRRAMGEDIRDLWFEDRVHIRRDARPVFRDGVSLHGDVATKLDRPAVADGARAMASLLWVAPEADAHLDALRDLTGQAGGVSLLRQGVLALRLLAEDGFALRRTLLPILDRLTRNQLPASWRL